MKYYQIRDQRKAKVSELIKKCRMFFAFSDSQLKERMSDNPLDESDKYVSIGAGAYMPKSNVEKYTNGCEQIDKWYNGIIKENNMDDEVILYELANHEAFYTGEIEDTYYALGCNYTKKKILEVYNKNYDKYADF